jgi:hypothetical protein
MDMINKFFVDKDIDEENNVEDKLTLNYDEFNTLTEDIESLVDQYTGVEGSSFMKCSEIRLHIMELIHQIVCSLHPLPPTKEKEKLHE